MKSSVSRPERMRSALTRVGADAVGAVVERVLAQEEQRRGLGQAIGAEVRAGVDRLLGGVEQQAAAGALRQHDLHCGLRHALVAEEVQLETLAQGRLVDLADPALPAPRRRWRRRCRRRRRRATTCVKGRADRGASVTSQASAIAVPPMLWQPALRGREVVVEQRDLGACRGEGLARSRRRSRRRRR